MGNTLDLTIVIPTKNEEAYLGRLLASLLRQDYPDITVTSIYVADAQSTDKTCEVAKQFQSKLDIRIIPGGLPAVGRNAGAKLATTPYILFLDADIELGQPNLIQKTLAIAQKKHKECVTTYIRCTSGHWDDQTLYLLNNVVQVISPWVRTPYATGMFMLWERKAFQRYGGFNEKAIYGEDFCLTRQVAPTKFGHVRGSVLTSNRRLKRLGHGQMIRIVAGAIYHRHDDQYFFQDHGFWD